MSKPRKRANSGSSKVPLHTTVSGRVYNKLLDFGKGALNAGIEVAVDLVEKKQYVVKRELERIADHVLSELSKDRRDDMKTIEDLKKEYDLAQRIVLEKTIELTLFNQGIDPEKVPMRDFDRLRRLSMDIDIINDRTNEEITKIKQEAQQEIDGIIGQLEAISLEIKAKQSSPAGLDKATEQIPGNQEMAAADGDSNPGTK